MDTQTRHALKQDSFVDATASSLDWVSEHRGLVIKTAVTVVIVAAVIVTAVLIYTSRESKAEGLFGQAMNIYETPLSQPGQPADPGQPSYATAVQRAKAAYPLFSQVANDYGWLRVGANARYFTGLTELDLGQSSAAESDLKKASGSMDSNLAALAKAALANVYHQTGRDSQAIDLLQGLIKNPTVTVPAGAAKLQLAALYEISRPQEAKRLYAELKDQDKETAAGMIATQKLQTLK
ncbi:coatomer subunit epsilon [Paracidobacterium acidisoli]|uniref:Coatomer subunit epsilon n=1 Tax=Paracidobacterium acidisoli TaxID=2303751 RepID=A0A372IPR4_9BACT|nr:coatomer subunit epsilon [Paracidobacterium acidisoli]MBT9331053.1 coatomer subunit epsilon [Paracidobacterium acidisoli]